MNVTAHLTFNLPGKEERIIYSINVSCEETTCEEIFINCFAPYLKVVIVEDEQEENSDN
jgi:hypothetical protein